LAVQCGEDVGRRYDAFLISDSARVELSCREVKVLSATYRTNTDETSYSAEATVGCLARPIHEVHQLKLIEACASLLRGGDRDSLYLYTHLGCKEALDRLRENPIPPALVHPAAGLACANAVPGNGEQDVSELVAQAKFIKETVIEAYLGEVVTRRVNDSTRTVYRRLKENEAPVFSVRGREALYAAVRARLSFLPPADAQGNVAAPPVNRDDLGRLLIFIDYFKETLNQAARVSSGDWYYTLKDLAQWARSTEYGGVNDRGYHWHQLIAQYFDVSPRKPRAR
jgi:hypothetical protein